ncbi:MAG: hypothetical protein RLZZ341_2237, partial [Pseudomonadota bacterium]
GRGGVVVIGPATVVPAVTLAAITAAAVGLARIHRGAGGPQAPGRGPAKRCASPQ